MAPLLGSRHIGDKSMAKVAPFHSTLEQDRNVYHDNDECTEGNNIEDRNRAQGTDGRPRCNRCSELS